MGSYDPFVQQLVKALGLPRSTRSFELRCAVDEAVTVKCEYFPERDDATGFDPVPALAEYRLVRQQDVPSTILLPQPVSRGACSGVVAAVAVMSVALLVVGGIWLMVR